MLKYFRNAIIFILIAVLFYIYLFYSENAQIPGLQTHFTEYFGVVLFSIFISLIARLVHIQLNKIVAWHKNLSMRFSLTIISIFLIVALFVFILISLRNAVLNPDVIFSEYLSEHNESFLRLFVLTVTFAFSYTVIDFSYYSYNHYSVVQIESERQIRKQIELQFEALKTQLSPHYLFNSLNTISLLIYKDQVLTEKFIRKLALTYQYILDSNEKKLTPIKEEIEFIKAYTYLIKVRYEEGFNVEIEIDKEIENDLIPPLSIQILLENAVKHNVLSNEKPLNVKIYNDKSFLIIENNILKKPSTQHSFKIGHSNIINRYAYFTDKKVIISKTNKYSVKLPIIVA